MQTGKLDTWCAGTCMAVLMACASLSGGAAFAETVAGEPKRTAFGQPDLQGDWTNTSMTVLERQNPSLPLVPSADQIAQMEAARARQDVAANSRTDPTQGAPAAGGGVGGYNAFWLTLGDSIGRVRGEARTSWIVEPASGRMPVSEAGKARIDKILAARGDTDPEGLNPADRCLVGSRGSGGPPMLNNLYNNTYQIVQTPTHVMINVEMMHDARIIRLDQDHKAKPLQQWLGDSVGHWDGETLVVETRNWKSAHGGYEPVFLSEDAVVTERFTRLDEDELLYEFEVADPGYYTQTWRGEMAFRPSSGPVFEYACHEGNYALVGILAGARLAD